jgi:hypothetical protein
MFVFNQCLTWKLGSLLTLVRVDNLYLSKVTITNHTSNSFVFSLSSRKNKNDFLLYSDFKE